MKFSFLLIFSLSLIPLILASQDGLVTKLDGNNFDSTVKNGGDWFIKLYYFIEYS